MVNIQVNQKFALQSFLLVCILSANACKDGIEMDDPGTELAQIILDSGAEIVTFTESKTASLLEKIISKIGDKWTGARAGSSAVLARMPLGVLDEQQSSVTNIAVGQIADHGCEGSAINGAGGVTVLLDVDEKGSFDKNSLIVSAIHPNYKNYAAYLPRGYDGLTWKPLPNGPITDVAKIHAANKQSKRKDQATEMLKIIEKYEAIFNANMTSIIAGDFNEPSGIDWSEGLKNNFGHNGVVYDWDVTRLLREKDYIDTFHTARLKKCGVTEESPQNEIDACIIQHPGFTWQSLPPKNVQTHKWAPNADDRDRIDFIFIRPSNTTTVEVKNSVVVGDNYYYGYYDGQTTGTSICKLDDPSSGTVDDFLTLGYPKSNGQHFPSDHRGVLTTVHIPRTCPKPSSTSESGAAIHTLTIFYFYLFIIFAYLF